MPHEETIRLLERAAHELRDVRGQRDLLAAQMEIVDVFRVALMVRPPQQAVGLDVAAYMLKHAAELRQAGMEKNKASDGGDVEESRAVRPRTTDIEATARALSRERP